MFVSLACESLSVTHQTLFLCQKDLLFVHSEQTGGGSTWRSTAALILLLLQLLVLISSVFVRYLHENDLK